MRRGEKRYGGDLKARSLDDGNLLRRERLAKLGPFERRRRKKEEKKRRCIYMYSFTKF